MNLDVLLNLLVHRPTRDLAWVIGAPSMMRCAEPEVLDDTYYARELESLAPRLLALDKAPLPLIDHLEQRRSQRLGEYFELLILYWQELAGREVLGHNLVVRDAQRTVGELDLLFEDAGEVFHWEVAVKFYLGYGPADARPTTAHWIGPNSRDRLDLKWGRFLSKQLRLASLPEARTTLDAHGASKKPRAQGVFKGYVFEPLDPHYAAPEPEDFAHDNRRGWWVHQSQRSRLLDRFDDVDFTMLRRLEWLSPALAAHHDGHVHSLSAFPETLGGRRSPTLVALFDDDGREFSRGFVVPDTWPAII